MFAEQCMGRTSFSGRRKLSTENMDFFISPAYRIPASSTLRCAKLIITVPSLAVPSRSGSQTKLGALTMFHTALLWGL